MADNLPSPPPAPRAGGEKGYYLLLGFVTLLLASLPYLYGWIATPAGHVFSGITYNIDDVAVYLSWMRQAESGAFFQRNLFTTEPQQGILFNLLFLLLGNVARVTGLSLILVYHVARVLFGALLLGAVAKLLQETFTETRARKLAFALVCISAGVGWTRGGYQAGAGFAQPIDLWQPEAITFLSLYYTPLFTAALFAIVVFWISVLRAERTGRIRDLWPALLCGALLGNFHSYDVVPLFAVWGIYRIVSDVLSRRVDAKGWVRLIVTGIAALPTTLYQAYALRAEAVFYARAFDTTTPSPALPWVLLGFGFLLPLCVSAAVLYKRDREAYVSSAAMRLLFTWAVVGVAVAYVPVAFQRKLIMGVHLPLCLLAGGALATLTARLPGKFPAIAALATVLIMVPSNLLWLQQDTGRLSVNEGSTPRQPYLKREEGEALDWLRKNARPGEAVLVSPDPTSHLRFPFFPLDPYLSVYVPAFAGATVYNGHWSETFRYGEEKLGRMYLFFRDGTPDDFRESLLQEHGIRYVLYANALADGPPRSPQGQPVLGPDNTPYIPVAWVADAAAPPYLEVAYRNSVVTVFRRK